MKIRKPHVVKFSAEAVEKKSGNNNNENNPINIFNNEVSTILFGDRDHELDKNEISYINMIWADICCSDEKKKYDYELSRTKKLLDIKTFKTFLIQSYAVEFKNFGLKDNEEQEK